MSQNATTASTRVSRRAVTRSAAWGLPAIMSATTAPAFAAASGVQPGPEVIQSIEVRSCDKGKAGRRVYQVDLTLSRPTNAFTVATVTVGKRTYRPTGLAHVGGTRWRMKVVTDQPLSQTGALTFGFTIDGFTVSGTYAYRLREGEVCSI